MIRFNFKPFLFLSTLNFSLAFSVSSKLLVREKGVSAQVPGNNSIDEGLQKALIYQSFSSKCFCVFSSAV